MSSYVRMRVAAEVYAVPVESVCEVADLGEVTAVPGARREILGVRNLRGHILPVIDLAVLLGVSRREPPGRLLVAECGGREAGLAIDEVSEVGEMGDPVEETDSRLLVGATLTRGELVGVIDVPAMFDALERPQS